MDCNKLQTFPALISFKTKQREHIYKWIKSKINYDDERKGYPQNFHKEVSFFDCILFPWQHMHLQFQQLYSKAVLDRRMREDLERCGALNWCQSFVKLEAIAVTNDGNCLLHSASFAMWSVDDEQHILRELLLLAVANDPKDSYKHRWWHQKLRDLKAVKLGSKIINTEWAEVVRSISSLSKAGGTTATLYSFLESIHIYVLANILRRPIVIVYASQDEQTKSHCIEDNHIAGIYLPLEWPPIRCCKTPLILGFSKGHFCPLLSEATLKHSKREVMFPLVAKDFSSLNVRFLSQQEEHRASELVQSYLRIREVSISTGASVEVPVPCTVLKYKALLPELDTVSEHFKVCEQLACQLPPQVNQSHKLDEARLLHQIQMNSQTKVAPMRSFSESYHISVRNQALKGKIVTQRGLSVEETGFPATGQCIAKGCLGQGNAAQGNFCDRCFKNYTIAEAGAELVSINTGQQKTFVLHKNSQARGAEGIDQEAEPVLIQPSAPPAQLLDSTSEPLSMLNVRCLNKCGYRCSQQTYPYCHECFKLMQSKPQTHPNAKFPPAGFVEGLSFLGVASPEAGVGDAGVNDVNNPQGNLMLFSPSPPLTAANPLAHTSPGSATHQREHQRGNPSDRSEQLCIQQGPLSLQHTLVNQQQLTLELKSPVVAEASDLVKKQQSVTAKHAGSVRIAMPEHNQEDDEEEIIEVSQGRETCVSPFCEEFVTFPNKLCEKCQEVLRSAHKQYNPAPSKQVTPQTFTAEKVVEAQSQKLNQIQIHNRSVHNKQRISDHETPAKRPVEMRTKQRGKPCITTGCSNYGDPVNAFMCSSCYKFALSEYEKLKRDHHKARTEFNPTKHHAQTAGNLHGVEPAAMSNLVGLSSFAPSSSSHSGAAVHTGHMEQPVPSSALVTNKSSLSPGSRNSVHGSLENFPTYDINVFNQGFAQAYDKFRDQTKAGLKTCKTPGCSNYGNPSKAGYCNSCHAEREEERYRERIAKYGETVPDCYTSQQNSI